MNWLQRIAQNVNIPFLYIRNEIYPIYDSTYHVFGIMNGFGIHSEKLASVLTEGTPRGRVSESHRGAFVEGSASLNTQRIRTKISKEFGLRVPENNWYFHDTGQGGSYTVKPIEQVVKEVSARIHYMDKSDIEVLHNYFPYIYDAIEPQLTQQEQEMNMFESDAY